MRYSVIFIFLICFLPGFTQKSKTANDEKKIDFKNKYFQGLKYIDTTGKMNQYRQHVELSEKDSTYFFEFDFSKKQEPFYMSDHEVTNGEYREFINWVRDSIAREKIIKRSYKNDKLEWLTYVDYNTGKKDETVDSKTGVKTDNGFYILNWDKKIDYDKPEIIFLLEDMYTGSERFYKRREIDTRLLLFDYYDDDTIFNRINVYPDTASWVREFDLRFESNQFWQTSYSNFPVIGITYPQAEAYCVWRTKMYQREAGRKSNGIYDKSLKFHIPTNAEWERAAYDYQNNYRNKEDNHLYHVQGGYETNRAGYYQANYGSTTLSSGLIQKNIWDDGLFETGKVLSYEPNFNELYCMYGNVAEWTQSNPELGIFFSDYVNPMQFASSWSLDSTKFLYITDPFTDSTFLLERGSLKHKEVISKRIAYYQVMPEDNFEEAVKKLFAINSISDEYEAKIQELNFPKDSLKSDSLKNSNKTGVIDGVFFNENQKARRHGLDLKLYNIETGSYFYTNPNFEENYYIHYRFKNAFDEFQQNAHALNRAKNSFSTNYLMEEDPTGYLRLVKGGSWIDEAHYLLLHNSQVFHKDQSSCRIGFRIAANSVGGELNTEDKKRILKQRELFKKDIWIKLNIDKK